MTRLRVPPHVTIGASLRSAFMRLASVSGRAVPGAGRSMRRSPRRAPDRRRNELADPPRHPQPPRPPGPDLQGMRVPTRRTRSVQSWKICSLRLHRGPWAPAARNRRSACHIPMHRRCFSDAYVTLRDRVSVWVNRAPAFGESLRRPRLTLARRARNPGSRAGCRCGVLVVGRPSRAGQGVPAGRTQQRAAPSCCASARTRSTGWPRIRSWSGSPGLLTGYPGWNGSCASPGG